MLKIKLIRKIMFFWGLIDLTDDIEYDFNNVVRIILSIPYLIGLNFVAITTIDKYNSNLNLNGYTLVLIFLFIILLWTYIFSQAFYHLSIKKYNSNYKQNIIKVTIIRKVLFFLSLNDLTNEIKRTFNHTIKVILMIPYMGGFYLFNKYNLTVITNSIVRIVILLSWTYIFAEISYLIAIKKYNKAIL